MRESERNEIIKILLLSAAWSEETLYKMNNRKLLETYDKYLKMR